MLENSLKIGNWKLEIILLLLIFAFAAIPTSADNAHFDANSNTTAYTVTVNATANMFDMMFYAAPAIDGTVIWAGSSAIVVYN